jgi:hypothetical protein
MTKQKIYLFIAILIPILMILIVALSVLIPVQKISPAYRFLYALGDNKEPFTCLQNMRWKFFPNKNTYNFYKIASESCKNVKLFVYDFNTDTPTPITFDAAKKLRLKETLPEADYFYISRDCYTGPILGLWSMRSTYNDVCLAKNDYKRLLNVNPGHSTEFFYFNFIGWILANQPVNQETK